MMMMMEEEEEENQHPKENEEGGEGKEKTVVMVVRFFWGLTHSGLCWWLYDVHVGKPDDKKEKGGDKADEKVR